MFQFNGSGGLLFFQRCFIDNRYWISSLKTLSKRPWGLNRKSVTRKQFCVWLPFSPLPLFLCLSSFDILFTSPSWWLSWSSGSVKSGDISSSSLSSPNNWLKKKKANPVNPRKSFLGIIYFYFALKFSNIPFKIKFKKFMFWQLQFKNKCKIQIRIYKYIYHKYIIYKKFLEIISTD